MSNVIIFGAPPKEPPKETERELLVRLLNEQVKAMAEIDKAETMQDMLSALALLSLSNAMLSAFIAQVIAPMVEK